LIDRGLLIVGMRLWLIPVHVIVRGLLRLLGWPLPLEEVALDEKENYEEQEEQPTHHRRGYLDIVKTAEEHVSATEQHVRIRKTIRRMNSSQPTIDVVKTTE
jgi:hypothetical protein